MQVYFTNIIDLETGIVKVVKLFIPETDQDLNALFDDDEPTVELERPDFTLPGVPCAE